MATTDTNELTERAMFIIDAYDTAIKNLKVAEYTTRPFCRELQVKEITPATLGLFSELVAALQDERMTMIASLGGDLK